MKITTRVYVNAYATSASLHALSWDELTDEIADACENVEAPGGDKRLLPALSTVVTDPPDAPRANEHIVGVSTIVLDVDILPTRTIAAFADRLTGGDALVYETSSSTPEAPRVRVVMRLTRIATPEEAHRLRFVVAEALGLAPGAGVERAAAAAQLFFVGRTKGTTPRQWARTRGDALDVDALAEAPLKHTGPKGWPSYRGALPTPTRRTGDIPTQGTATPRVEATAEALLKMWPEPGEITPGGGRRPVLRALGGWLARLGWSDEEIVALVDRLPTARGRDVSVALAIECARQCRDTEGEVAAGWDSLRTWASSAGAEAELSRVYAVAKDPRMPEGWAGGVWSEWWARVYARAYRWCTGETAVNVRARPSGQNSERDASATHTAVCGKSFASITHWLADRELVAWDDRGLKIINTPAGRPWRDADTGELRCLLSSTELELPKDKLYDAVVVAAHAREYDPVVDYLDALPVWDGTPRSALASHFGAAPGLWADACWRVLSLGAVARALDPGCKCDTMVVLEGGQGLYKSTGLRILAGAPHFSDTIIRLDDPKHVVEGLAGVWIQEIGELSGLRGRDAQKVKAVLSSQRDRVRLSYARTPEDVPRRSVFVGTTNPDGGGWLSDTTGNRRFLPITVGRVDVAALVRDRDQLWAEAVARYRAGEHWWLTPQEVLRQQDETEERAEGDPWAADIAPWLAKRKGNPCTINEVMTEVLLLGADRQDQRAANRAARVLKGLGWERFRAPRDGAGARAWKYRPVE